MPQFVRVALLVMLLTSASLGEKKEHTWLVGKILDTNQVSHYAGTVSNASASATSYGNSASGNASGSETAIYRVYDTLVVEGMDYVYFTSEQLHWRWSKGAHVAVNAEIKYYVDGRKLHVLDQDGKEHSLQITKTIKREGEPISDPQNHNSSPASVATQVEIPVSISSTPPGSDIEIDGAFVGSTPSTVSIAPGKHAIAIKKKGFADWSRNVNVVNGNISISAELESITPKP
jgi:hypothetical protein